MYITFPIYDSKGIINSIYDTINVIKMSFSTGCDIHFPVNYNLRMR